MPSFAEVHGKAVVGELTMFDRMIFKGHLTKFFPDGAFKAFLDRQGVLLRDFGRYVERMTAELRAHVETMAAEAGRPLEYLAEASTRRSGLSKEERARAIAEADGITEGLVCVFSTVEPCRSFDVKGNRKTQRLEVVRRSRKCLHYYCYFVHPELGFIHVRLQSWFPFEVQVWANGREWLARQLDRKGVGYTRYANCFVRIDRLGVAQALCLRFARRRWPRLLDDLARAVNPHLGTVRRAGFGGYWWCLDQAEVATDVMFSSRPALEAVLGDVLTHAATALSCGDVLRFLGRKLHGNLAAEVTTSSRRRPEGVRVKHSFKRNSVKVYDKASVLRVETTINNPREFKVLRVVEGPDGRRHRRWMPMGKSVANAWRYFQVATAANGRYLDALASAPLRGKGVEALDALCRPRTRGGRRHARLHPLERADTELFKAVLAGEHVVSGFRNKDITARLYRSPATTPEEARRRCARTSRLIAKLRGHGLVAKVRDSRLYRVTPYGQRAMSAAVHVRSVQFPDALSVAA